MVPLKKLCDIKGQSITEYTVVAMLVAAGIIISGGIVVNSWNAGMKQLDSSYQDSFDDKQDQASEDEIEVPPCICSDWTWFDDCGNTTLGQPRVTGDCYETEHLIKRFCYPLDCESSLVCEPSASCCTPIPPNELGCAAAATPPCDPGEKRLQFTCGIDSGWIYPTERCYEASPPPLIECGINAINDCFETDPFPPYGSYAAECTFTCEYPGGLNEAQWRCLADPHPEYGECDFVGHLTFCDGSDQNLTSDGEYQTTADCGDPNVKKCMYECTGANEHPIMSDPGVACVSCENYPGIGTYVFPGECPANQCMGGLFGCPADQCAQ